MLACTDRRDDRLTLAIETRFRARRVVLGQIANLANKAAFIAVGSICVVIVTDCCMRHHRTKTLHHAIGCALFCKICNLPEYYPTRTEARIFDREREAIVAAIGTGKQLIDLGAGDCAKAAAWLPWLQPSTYVAVDIAADALEQALPKLALAYPEIDIRGVLVDFTRGLDLDLDGADGPTTFFYPGSSIGNFTPADALEFLNGIRRHCAADSGLLIGVDTKKDPARLRAAYDDAAGVTAAFNRNVLLHVNRVLGTRFRPDGIQACRAVQRSAVARGDAPRGNRRANGDDRRHWQDLSRRRTDPYREFVQVRARRVRRDARSAPGSRTCASGRTTHATSPCATRPPTAPADRGAPFFRFRIANRAQRPVEPVQDRASAARWHARFAMLMS